MRSLILAVVTLLLSLVVQPAIAKTNNYQRKHKPHHVVRIDPSKGGIAYAQRADVMQFGTELAQRQQLDPQWVQAALAQSRFIPQIAKLITPLPEGSVKNWSAYRSRFVTPLRIQAGLTFWNSNEAWLNLAQERYGVPPEVIVGIIGVETIYGQQQGNFRVIDALATLAFDFPPVRKDRSLMFKNELESFFVLCHKEGVNPLDWKGSYAGAIGIPQFMPSSINRDAVDFDGDGHIDLQNQAADAIGSVANFLDQAGWMRDLPIYFDLHSTVTADAQRALLGPDILPLFSPEEFVENGVVLAEEAMGINSKLALIELQNGGVTLPTYVAGTSNFYAITRYNRSSYYAMAVMALGQAVKQQRKSE